MTEGPRRVDPLSNPSFSPRGNRSNDRPTLSDDAGKTPGRQTSFWDSVDLNYGNEYWSLYILELEGDRFYVGVTKQFETRFRIHRAGDGPEWTRRYPPTGIAALDRDFTKSKPEALARERTATLRWMGKEGWQNVRGGPWTDPELEYPPGRWLGD